ncbi:MAG: type II toxin-antitoxin system VapC family toxin [Gallionella sp.]|jgi:tRNA(fMet)-specific endonuclease VapC
MTRYMLDTNVLIHIVNQHGNWRKALRKIDHDRVNVCLSAVAFFELSNMVLAARTGKDKAQQLSDMVNTLKVEPFNRRAADTASSLLVHLEKSGKTIGQRDAMIAGHAKQLNCVCVTHNEGEYGRVHGLIVENWIGD